MTTVDDRWPRSGSDSPARRDAARIRKALPRRHAARSGWAWLAYRRRAEREHQQRADPFAEPTSLNHRAQLVRYLAWPSPPDQRFRGRMDRGREVTAPRHRRHGAEAR